MIIICLLLLNIFFINSIYTPQDSFKTYNLKKENKTTCKSFKKYNLKRENRTIYTTINNSLFNNSLFNDYINLQYFK